MGSEDIFIHTGGDTVRMYNVYWKIDQFDNPSPVFINDIASAPTPSTLALGIMAMLALWRRKRV